MKYFKVKNDIIKTDIDGNPSWTDEPLWLRNEIDQWKERYGEDIGGGRFFATEDARYSYIISPNEDLMDLAEGDLEELTEEEILEVIAIAFPPQKIEREGEPDEWIPTPTLEKVCSVYWHYATNHTGTISASESWTLANNDHHITGNITLNANVVLTIDAGVNVYYDGNYSISRNAGTSGSTTITAVGTSASRITFESNVSRTNTAQYNTITTMFGSANNCTTTLQYCNFANAAYVLNIGNTTGQITTLDHLYIRDCDIFVRNNTSSTVIPAVTISNSKFYRLNTKPVVYGSPSVACSCNINDCELISGPSSSDYIFTSYTSSITYNYTDVLFDMGTGSTAGGVQGGPNFTRCLLKSCGTWIGLLVTNFTDCINLWSSVGGATIYMTTTAVNGTNLTNCDLIGPSSYPTNYALRNGSSVATTLTATSCYIAGNRGADIYNYYTGTETPAQTSAVNSGIITLTTPRTTRNFPFTQSSISSSSIGDNTATISWTGAFRTRNRVRYGTVSGTYNMTVEPIGSWSNWDGKGQYAASPSIVLNNLKVATTYYYVCESYDWATDVWNTSAENTFTTTGALTTPTFSGISSLTNLASSAVGVLASWSASSGTTTEYKVYVKKDNATSLFTDTYYKCKLPNTQTSVELYTYADNTTNIANGDLVYVGIRACNSSDCDTNSTSLSVTATAGSAPTFAGITGLEPIGFGALLASWSAATGTTTNYNVYIKIGSAPTFSEKPIKVDTTYTSFKITHLSDGTRIQDTDNVYVSVRAENTPTLIDTNTAVLNLYPVGSGSTGVIVGDTVAIALKG